MADLPGLRLAPQTPPFYYTACDYFGLYNVKIERNRTTKHYGVIFTCLNTGTVHMELAVDSSTMEFMQVLRTFFSIRGYPAVIGSLRNDDADGNDDYKTIGLVSKNNGSARSARAFYILVHFFAVISKMTM